MFEAALGTAGAFILLFGYIGFKKIAGYAVIVDIAVFALCIYMFMGTYAGMMTGILAGGIISLFLKAIIHTVGVQRLKPVRYEGDILPTLRWEDIK